MASSSSSSTSIIPKPEYEVFFSFRGEDTRKKITSHLDEALRQKKIIAFIDDDLKRGEEIFPAPSKAIEQSKISVIIFSKGYASSRWCLKELEKILKCKDKYAQIVIPIFYEVDPSDVRNQTGDFGNAFSELESRFGGNPEMLLKWRTALRDAADLSGFVSRNHRNEALLVKNIVNDILKKLDRLYDDGSEASHTKNLVGLDSSIKTIKNLLCSNRTVGIWGMGGIGKTTLAFEVFKRISKQFEASCFVRNFGEESKASGGLNKIFQKLIYDLLGDLHPNIESIFSRQRLNRKKVLIVFDDVTLDEKQTDFVNKTFECLYSESRIIITTRDQRVLTNCEVHEHGMHKMEKLCFDNALQLFSLHAFKENRPTEGYSGLSESVVAYCEGLPLALKVSGAYLYKRTKGEWESALNNLKNSIARGFGSRIYEVLKISYDGLNHEEKVVFLDIACFFKGYQRDRIEAILKADDFDYHICISVLIEKSLLITESLGTIGMHDLLQEMGKKIVQQESIHDFSKRSHLWNYKDIIQVLENNEGNRAIRSIRLDMSEVTKLHLNPKAFNNMPNLRFLEFYGSEHEKKVPESDSSAWGFEVLKYDFSELKYFCWDGYPAKSLPPNFNPRNLVELCMSDSKVKELWTGNQELVNLKYIFLDGCKHLCRMPDFSLMPNLRKINLSNCSNLKTVPYLPATVEELYLGGTPIKELVPLEHLFRLKILGLSCCSLLERLPKSDRELKSLRYLDLRRCSKLARWPNDLKNLTTLESLSLVDVELPTSVTNLINLKDLGLTRCNIQKQLSNNLFHLLVFQKMTSLMLQDCNIEELPDNIGQLQSLQFLEINQNNFESLPVSIKDLSELIKLDVSDCKRLKSLPELPININTIIANNCISLESLSVLPSSSFDWGDISREFRCYNCSKLQLDMEKESLKFETAIHKIDPVEIDEGSAVIFYSGSDIPNWFTIQGTDDFIEFPFNFMIVGYVLCVVVSLQDCQEFAFTDIEYSFFLDGKLIITDHFFGSLLQEIGVLQSDHVLLVFGNTMRLNDLDDFDLISPSRIELWLCGENDRILAKVKKYGVRLLYDKYDVGEEKQEDIAVVGFISRTEADDGLTTWHVNGHKFP